MSETDTPNPKPSASAAKKNTKTLWIVVAVVAVLVAIPAILFTIGAGIVGHKVINGVKVSNDGKSATIQTKNGDEISTGGSQSLPKDFPSSVATYQGTIINSSRLTMEGKVNWSVVIETKDDPTKVSDALTKSFASNGWTASLDNKTGDGGLIAAENGSFHVQVIYTVKDGKTSISYVVVPVTAQ